MKKLLIATTALVATAGVAAADITLSGLGRFGINHNGGAAPTDNRTTIGGRLRFNIDGSIDTDSGVTFGGRVRIQNDFGHPRRGTTAVLNQAMLTASYGGFRMEVGNTNTAIDSAGLYYRSELGYDRSISGNGNGGFFSYKSDIGGAAASGRNYMGIYAQYTFGDFVGRISHIQPDQLAKNNGGREDETSVSVDWASGAIAVSAAYASNAGGTTNDHLFFGGQYDFGAGTVAVLYYDEEGAGVNADPDAKTITLNGTYGFGATTLRGFVSSSDDRGTKKTSFGIGADYDLGGATLAGGVGRDWNGETVANLGVMFNF